MKDLWIIVTPQEYERANHKHLWLALARKLEAVAEVVALNVAADLVYTVRERRFGRILDAFKPCRRVAPNLSLLRPMTLFSPLRASVAVNKLNALILSRRLARILRQHSQGMTYILFYNPKWIEIIEQFPQPLHRAYYIFDELGLAANSGRPASRLGRLDRVACEKADSLLVMSNRIADARAQFGRKTIVVGNGASLPNVDEGTRPDKVPNSVGFVGNFRDWIDLELLRELIASRQDLTFCFAGTIQRSMQPHFDRLVEQNANVRYLGVWPKEQVHQVYQMMDVVIVPYRANDFVAATRPIKIVESIFAGTPVVTVPVDGYRENSFIRFATTAAEFSEQIDHLRANPIDKFSEEHREFVAKNSWDEIASRIIKFMTSNERKA